MDRYTEKQTTAYNIYRLKKLMQELTEPQILSLLKRTEELAAENEAERKARASITIHKTNVTQH